MWKMKWYVSFCYVGEKALGFPAPIGWDSLAAARVNGMDTGIGFSLMDASDTCSV